MPEPLYFDSHMHTPLCKHAEGEPVEYAQVGRARGLKGIIMTCHSPMPGRFSHHVRMAPEQFDDYVRLVAEATREMQPEGFPVRLGLESDYFPGMEPWLEDLHQRADFHYILGSVHPFIAEYRERYFSDDPVAFQRGYFSHLADAAETGLFDCLSHPDIVKTMFPETWDFALVRSAVSEALDRIATTGIAMELNTSGLLKSVPEMNPGPEMLEMIAKRNIPIVLGSDSHRPGRVGDLFPRALDLLETAGFTRVCYFEERRRVELPIGDVRESLSSGGEEQLPLFGQ